MKRPDIATITFHKQVPRDAVDHRHAGCRAASRERRRVLRRRRARAAHRREADGSLAYAMGFDNVRKGDIAYASEGIALLTAPA